MIIALIIFSYLLSVFTSWLGIRSFLKTTRDASAIWIIFNLVPGVNLIAGALCWAESIDDFDEDNIIRKFYNL